MSFVTWGRPSVAVLSLSTPLHSLVPSSPAPQSLSTLPPLLPEDIHSLTDPDKFCTQLCHLLMLPTCVLHHFIVKFPDQAIHTHYSSSLFSFFSSEVHTLILLNDGLGSLFFYSLTSYKPTSSLTLGIPLSSDLPLASLTFLLANCSGMKLSLYPDGPSSVPQTTMLIFVPLYLCPYCSPHQGFLSHSFWSVQILPSPMKSHPFH